MRQCVCVYVCDEMAVPPVRPLATPWARAMPRLGDEASAMRRALVAKDRTLCLIILAGCGVGGLRCLVSIACCRRATARSSRHELKRFPDKADWQSRPWRGRSRHRPRQSYGGLSAERVNGTSWWDRPRHSKCKKDAFYILLLFHHHSFSQFNGLRSSDNTLTIEQC